MAEALRNGAARGEAGGSLIISYVNPMDGDDVYGTVNIDLSVNGKLKVTVAGANLKVDDREYSAEEDCYLFAVSAVSAGESTLKLYNKIDAKEIVLTFNVAEGTEENPGYKLTLTDSHMEAYDERNSEEYKEAARTAAELFRKAVPNAFIPASGKINDVTTYRGTNPNVLNPEDADTAEMEILCGGHLYSYTASRAISLASFKNMHTSASEIKSEEELQVSGVTANFYTMADGYSVALWQSGDGSYAAQLILMEDATESEAEQFTKSFLGDMNMQFKRDIRRHQWT